MLVKSLTEEQLKLYDDKFKLFDSSSFEVKQDLMKKDPTLFAYGLFRDLKGERLKLFPYQDLYVNDKSKMIAMALPRQSGKTTSAMIKAFHYIFYHDNATVLVISKTLNQSKEMISKLRQIVNSSPLRKSIQELADGPDNKSEYYIKNYGKDTYSRIISVPATDAARGFTADIVIADEIAFWDNSEEMFNEAVLPTVTATDGEIDMLSTPKSTIGVFYYAFTKPDIWSLYQFDWRVCPSHTVEKMARIKEQIGEFSFRQEYEASFTANQAAYFREGEVKDAVDEGINLGQHTSYPVIVGVDFGKMNDNSVLTVGFIENPYDDYDFQKVKVVDVIALPLGTPYNEVVGAVVNLCKKYNVIQVIYDQTGVGEGPGDFMKDLGLPVEGLKFSISSKIDIYSNLKLLFEKRLIKFPKVKNLIEEALLFEYEYTTSGNMKLHHPEGGHDDYIDSLALCCYGLKRPEFISPGISFIGNQSHNRIVKEDKPFDKKSYDDLVEEEMEDVRNLMSINKRMDRGF